MRGFVAEIQRRRLAASGFARARPETCGIFRRAEERIPRGDSTAQTGYVRFCRNATGGLRHFRRARGDLTRRLNSAGWLPLVLQKRDRRLSPFFSRQMRGDLTRRFDRADGRFRFCMSATGNLRHLSAGGRIPRGDSTAQTGYVRFCKSATGDLQHLSADARKDLSQRFNGADGRFRFCMSAPATCGIFPRADGWFCRGDSTAQTGRVRFCRSATGGLRHFSADGRICREDSTAWTAASCFAEARPAACAIFQRTRG